jgi:hypothetical protein
VTGNGDKPHDCLKENKLSDPETLGELTVRVCQVCGRRHFEAEAEPFLIGVKPT